MSSGHLFRSFFLLVLLTGRMLPAASMCQTCIVHTIAHVNTFLANTEGEIIDNHGVANSLIQKLQAALNAVMDGRLTPARNIIGAFQNEVAAQTGHHINNAAAAILQQDAAAITGGSSD